MDVKKSNTRYDLAVDHLRNGDYDTAEAEAHKALRFNPENANAYHVLGLVDMLRAVNNLTLLEVQDCLTGIDAEALRSEMDELLASADENFEKAIEIDPEYGEAMASRGVVALNLEDYKRAVSFFRSGLDYPTRLESASLTRANLGWALFQLGDVVGAAKELRQAEQFQPGMCLASYRMGRVYFERKEWEKAHEKFSSVVSKGNACPIQEAHLYLATTSRQLGMTSVVNSATSSCVQMAPKSCMAAKCRVLASEPNPGDSSTGT